MTITPAPPASADSSAEQVGSRALPILVAWANAQDPWVRATVLEVILSRQEPGDASLTRLYELMLVEKGLRDGGIPEVPELSVGADVGEKAETLSLLALKNIVGVNALAPNQEITFNKTLTLIFGENATGKTGYVRVLKRLAQVRATDAILPDVHATAPPKAMGAEISYKLGDSAEVCRWTGDAGVSPFTRMSVFDTGSVGIHVDGDLPYLYTPSDLALFRHIHSGMTAIRDRLDAKRRATEPKGNPFTPQLPRGTRAFQLVDTLGPTTELAELERLASVTESEQEQLEHLRNTVEALSSQALQTNLTAVTARRDLFQLLQGIVATLTGFDFQGYEALRGRMREARLTQEASGATAFQEMGLPAALSEPWQSFIEAGERYLEHLGANQYPDHDDACVYCRQPLGPAAAELVRRYRVYAAGAAAREAEETDRLLSRATNEITQLRVREAREAIERIASGVNGDSVLANVLTAGAALLDELEPVMQQAHQHDALEPSRVVVAARGLEATLAARILDADTLLGELRGKADERQRVLGEEQAKLRELEGRLALRQLLPEVRTFVSRAKWGHRAGQVGQRFQGLFRSLTESSKQASEELLNQNFGSHFSRDCEALHAPVVVLDFLGRQGQPARRKVISAEHRLSHILSEGEQKVIALADFLAEASLRNASATIVFDDPVNSLDYNRIYYVCDRLAQLAAEHQIVVFTHNIWFATELMSRFEKSPEQLTVHGVTVGGTGKGVVTHGVHPRQDTPAKLAGKVNNMIQTATVATGETQAALIEKAYDLIRSWCETIVEQELLKGVTQRYQPNVQMTKLTQINGAALSDAVAVITPLFEKACRYMTGHSQPMETLGVRPTIDELRADWAQGEAAVVRHRNATKSN